MRRWRPRLQVPQWPLLGRAFLVGVGGGMVGAAYLGLLHLLQRVLWPTNSSPPVHFLILVGIGAVIAVLIKVLGNPGDVELLVDNVHVLGGRDDTRDLRSLIPVSLLGIAAGGALGPEAPLVQTTGSLGSWAAARGGLERDDVRALTITGMAAGFTVLFGAPMGAAHHSAVELVDRAAAAGLVERVPDSVDARCQRLFLTPEGEGKLARLAGLHREELRRLRDETFAHLLSLG